MERGDEVEYAVEEHVHAEHRQEDGQRLPRPAQDQKPEHNPQQAPEGNRPPGAPEHVVHSLRYVAALGLELRSESLSSFLYHDITLLSYFDVSCVGTRTDSRSTAHSAFLPPEARSLLASVSLSSTIPVPLPPLLARLAAHPADAPAVGVAGSSGLESYGSVRARAAAIAEALGPLAGAPVAFLVEPGPSFVELLLGVLGAGGLAVPLSPLHTRPELG